MVSQLWVCCEAVLFRRLLHLRDPREGAPGSLVGAGWGGMQGVPCPSYYKALQDECYLSCVLCVTSQAGGPWSIHRGKINPEPWGGSEKSPLEVLS